MDEGHQSENTASSRLVILYIFSFNHLLNILKENREVVKKTPSNSAMIFFLFPPHLWNNSVHLAFVCVMCVMTHTKGKCLSEKTRDRVSDFPT